MIRFDFDVRAENIKEIVARLKEIDPDLVKAFRRELKATGRDVASTVQSRINTIPPPLSNMQYGSARALRWTDAKATVRTDLSVRRRKSVSDLLWINVDSPKGSPGYIVAETAGSRGAAKSLAGGRSAFGGSARGDSQGQNLVAVMTDKFGPLKGKGGNRIAWSFFWQQRSTLNKAAMVVVEKFSDMVSREVND